MRHIRRLDQVLNDNGNPTVGPQVGTTMAHYGSILRLERS